MARYFMHRPPTRSSQPIYWRGVQNFAGVFIHVNLNLLAQAVGDPVRAPKGFSLVPAEKYSLGAGAGTVVVQPRVVTDGTDFVELPLGPRLKRFLDYPVGDFAHMKLRPPFYDSTRDIGDNGGGWFRRNTDDSAWHGGFDVMGVSFQVCAAAQGEVIGLGATDNSAVVLQHQVNSRPFVTVYQHLDLNGTTLSLGQSVGRGEPLGATSSNPRYPHLHFMVAVQREVRTSTGSRVQAWFAIDAFGVYDYYLNRRSRTIYNYLPDRPPNCWSASVRGANHPILWERQPLSSLL